MEGDCIRRFVEGGCIRRFVEGDCIWEVDGNGGREAGEGEWNPAGEGYGSVEWTAGWHYTAVVAAQKSVAWKTVLYNPNRLST